jgi:phosphocarrier protein
MVSQKVVVKNESGLHLRPAGNLCKLAIEYNCSIHFQFHDTNANAKSVLSVLSACVKSGDEVEFICDGEDEKEALQAIVEAIENGLGEKAD